MLKVYAALWQLPPCRLYERVKFEFERWLLNNERGPMTVVSNGKKQRGTRAVGILSNGCPTRKDEF